PRQVVSPWVTMRPYASVSLLRDAERGLRSHGSPSRGEVCRVATGTEACQDMTGQLPSLPFTDAPFIFAILMSIILLTPMMAERARVPGIVGLVLAGTVVGPHGLGLIERSGMMATLGAAGLLYLLMLVGLELDLGEFAKNRAVSMVFGLLTFTVPMAVGVPVGLAMGFGLLPSLLLASCWAAHTLLTYPVFRQYGSHRSRSVAASVGATIITDTAALLVLVGVVRAHQGDLGIAFWLTLAPSFAVLLGVTLWLLPRFGRWFFSGLGQDRSVRFLFVLVALFGASALAQVLGMEAIIGAFLAGLGLNRLVPDGSQVMERIDFFGSQFLIPLFLVSVGMLIDPLVILDQGTMSTAAAFVAVALGAKLVAAWLAGRLFSYRAEEIGAMFSLSGTRAAATLAAVIVGLDVGLIGAETVNAVIIVILVTALVTAWSANRYAPRLPSPAPARKLGGSVIVPIARPESIAPLLRLAASIARPDGGFVVPVSVVTADRSEEAVLQARARSASAESTALSFGAEAHGVVRMDASPAAGMLHAVAEHSGSLLVLGWKGHSNRREALFGGIMDDVVEGAVVPVLIARLLDRPVNGVLLAISEANASPAGAASLLLAVAATGRYSADVRVGVRVVTNSPDPAVAQLVRRELGVEAVRDDRRRSAFVPDIASPDELIVIPVKPEATGLRGAAERIARRVPGNSIVVAMDRRGMPGWPNRAGADEAASPASAAPATPPR
ncbi:MAG TPA: cation:proton antiporter, partial [Egibacteraceae bacterium]|nr:cation:proton antiporter [Egibacteraceae bacterium]